MPFPWLLQLWVDWHLLFYPCLPNHETLTQPERLRETAKTMKSNLRPVIVCTEHRGVFFGYAEDTTGDPIHLKDARMAIYFGTTKGVMQLAETGPTSNSKISAKADIEIRKITAVLEVSEAAAKAWEANK